MKNILYISLLLLFASGADLRAQQPARLGSVIFKEDFGTIPPVSEWSAENGDNTVYNDPKTYRRKDNKSSYIFLSYVRRGDTKTFSLNSTKPVEKPLGAVGDWTFGGNYTKPLLSTPEPFNNQCKNKPQYVWCRVDKGALAGGVVYTQTDNSYSDNKDVSSCNDGQSVRWIYDTKWKLGFWNIALKTERGDWLDVGKYAVAANFYQIGENDWANIPADHSGNTDGLSFMVNSDKSKGTFYTLTLDNLIAGIPYNLSLFVINPDTKGTYPGILGDLFPEKKTKPDLTITEKENPANTISSGELEFGELIWYEQSMNFTPKAPAAGFDFSLKADEKRGNGIAIDDITVRPYLFEAGTFAADLCSSYSTVTLTSTARSLLDAVPLFSRWARRDTHTGTWSWLEAAGQTFTREVTAAEYSSSDYRIVLSYSESLLNNMLIEQSDASGNSEYRHSATIEGVQLPVFELYKSNNICIAGSSPDNTYEVELKLTGEVTSFSYQIGEHGDEIPILSPAEGLFTIPQFTAPANSSILITKCEFQGCEIQDITTFPLPHKAKVEVTGIPEKIGIFENEDLTFSGTQTSTLPNAEFKWFGSEDFTAPPLATGLSYTCSGLHTGTHTFYLAEEGSGRCLFVRRSEAMVFPLPEANVTANHTLKLSEAFSTSLTGVKNAAEYEIRLQSATYPDFTFIPIRGILENNESGTVRIEFIQGNSALLSSSGMVGQSFTFTLTIWQEYSYNNTIYKKPVEKEITFSVIAEPGIYLPAPPVICAGSNLTLKPVIGGDPDMITSYQWYMDGHPVSTDPELSVTNLTPAHNNRTITVTITYPGGESSGNPVAIHVFDPAENLISTTDPIVMLRQRINLSGSKLEGKEINYQWQQKSSGKDWENISGEKYTNLTTTLVRTTKYRRMASAGECQLTSNEILIEAFDNEQNTISYNEDSQIAPHTPVEVEGSLLTYETTPVYQWQQKAPDGTWADIAGADGTSLHFTPGATTMVRRMVSAGNCTGNSSNIRIISVYTPGKENEIYYKYSYSLPGSDITLTGTEPARSGCTFVWLRRPAESAGWQSIPGADSRNLDHTIQSSAEFTRVMSFQDDAGNQINDTSNTLRINVYDNSQNTISGAASLCKYNETNITGSKPDYPEPTYQWQASPDGEVWEHIGINTQSLRTNITATSWFRRIVNLDNLTNNISNTIRITAVDFALDNILPDAPILSPESEYTIEGAEIEGVSYRWQNSTDGKTWTDLAPVGAASLKILTGNAENTSYYRRGIFTEAGCEDVSPWSNHIKIVTAVLPDINKIETPQDPVCPNTVFTITGNQREDALYSWKYSADGNTWKTVALASEPNLTFEGGVNLPTLFMREIVLDGALYRSNLVVIQVYNFDRIHNHLENPAPVCQGESLHLGEAETEIPVVDLHPLPGNFPQTAEQQHTAIASVYWEKSITGATGTWSTFANDTAVRLDSVTDEYKYRRTITLINGLNHLSNEISPQVNEKPVLTIYSNIPLDKLNISAPIRINVTPDYLQSYEFKVNGKISRQTSAVLESYDWIPDVTNTITVKSLTDRGCVSEQAISFKGPHINLPNVITCNGDGKNDILLPGYELTIFNRLGSLIFEGNQGWDGKFRGEPVSSGTYFYKVKIRMSDGSVREYQNNVIVYN